MEKTDILSDLNEIFKEVLDNDSIVLNYETTAHDIEEWESLSHIQLIIATENKYKIRFTSAEVGNMTNVDSLCNMILEKL